ncbi:hypothetical protein RF11_11874 [Thelohanellus kitauei]|uniref:Uncharacterized protein n=1 Tax=Thelohanellus kitauei TaxID=669202 RepID=A0A0C2JA63_THEKT|nr:hypothetical protein RF11_11874 [Thelohanellus kitauei]
MVVYFTSIIYAGVGYKRKLIALDFLPPRDAGSTFDDLSGNRRNNLQNIYNYKEDNYVCRLRQNRRDSPSFSITMWKMRCVADSLPRSNHSVKASITRLGHLSRTSILSSTHWWILSFLNKI